MHGETAVTVVIEHMDRQFQIHEVPCSVSYGYDPGCRSHRNGDPGESPSEDFQFSCLMTEEEAIEVVTEEFLRSGEPVPPSLQKEGASILQAIQKEAYTRVYDSLVDSTL